VTSGPAALIGQRARQRSVVTLLDLRDTDFSVSSSTIQWYIGELGLRDSKIT
jgi:hypothetical protein